MGNARNFFVATGITQSLCVILDNAIVSSGHFVAKVTSGVWYAMPTQCVRCTHSCLERGPSRSAVTGRKSTAHTMRRLTLAFRGPGRRPRQSGTRSPKYCPSRGSSVVGRLLGFDPLSGRARGAAGSRAAVNPLQPVLAWSERVQRPALAGGSWSAVRSLVGFLIRSTRSCPRPSGHGPARELTGQRAAARRRAGRGAGRVRKEALSDRWPGGSRSGPGRPGGQ